jgi:hypothetical protein
VLLGCSAAATRTDMRRHQAAHADAGWLHKQHMAALYDTLRHGAPLALNQRVQGSSPRRRTNRSLTSRDRLEEVFRGRIGSD